MNRKRKQRKSSVRRGARKELDQKKQKRLLLLGTEPCTPTANTVYIRYIYGKTVYIWFIRRIYTALCKTVYTDTDTDTVASTNIRPYIYAVYMYAVYIRIRFWPTLYIRYCWQGNHHIYGHVRCIYTVLAIPIYDRMYGDFHAKIPYVHLINL